MHTVLIADDHELARETVSRWVRRLEPRLHVVQVGDGPAALRRLRRRDVGVAVLDHRMPGALGLEVLQTARAERIDTPTLLSTAYADAELAVAATRAGAAEVLTKPPDFRRLVSRIVELAGIDRPVVSPTAREVLGYIEQHLADSDLGPVTIAQAFGLTKGYVQELVNAARGMPVMALVNHLRVERAKAELERTDERIGGVSRRCGFACESTFRRVFERATHKSPRAYRRGFPLELEDGDTSGGGA